MDSHSCTDIPSASTAEGTPLADARGTLLDAGDTKRPLLDAAAFPHIIDNIIRFAPTASLAVLYQTCTTLRDRTRAALFEHVLFLRTGKAVHILTAAPPYLYLGSFVKDHLRGASSASIHYPDLAHTRVLDAYNLPPMWSLNLHMPRLEVLRRVYNPYATKNRFRYALEFPCARTTVDHVDLSARDVSGWSAGRPHRVEVIPPYATEHHILHLSWHEWDPFVSSIRLRLGKDTKTETVVFHPYGEGKGPTQHFRPLAHLLSSGWRGTIVGAERMHDHGPLAWLEPSNGGVGAPVCATTVIPYFPGVTFETYESWAAGFRRAAEPAPETMEAYYRQPKVRRGGVAEERV